jgi:flagellum-specific ATP synthase
MTGSTETAVQPGANRFGAYLKAARIQVAVAEPFAVCGKLTRAAGLVLEAVGLKLPVGCTCTIVQEQGQNVDAEVVGFANDHLFLMPTSDVNGLLPGALVVPDEPPAMPLAIDRPHHPWRRAVDRTRHLPMGDGLLGRVVDSNGRALDHQGPLLATTPRPLRTRPINPIDREPIAQVLDTGVRAINALLTVGRGQRIGLFSGSGVGKSVLLGMMARYTSADVIVVGLIGERGREVKEFVENILGTAGRARAVVVAAPADTPPLLRMQGATYATAIAEYFRDQGKHVLLLLDSLTRYAMAQREIALAVGEPPATKGYPPSVFAKLPALVERTGNGPIGRGSITAFYTVLVEGDDQQDPIADSARAILDGHFVLSRALAEQGHFPAIDIEQSISRVMHRIIDPQHEEDARKLRLLYSRYQKNRDLINLGAYLAGSDPVLDAAVSLQPGIEAFMQQGMNESASFAHSQRALNQLLAGTQVPTR